MQLDDAFRSERMPSHAARTLLVSALIWWPALIGPAHFFASADEITHLYKPREHVVLWLNKVGPYNNPQETYSFYRLPFCRPEHIVDQQRHKRPGLGEILEGTEYINSGLLIEFGVDRPHAPVCSKTLTKEEADAFRHAVSNFYWYQLYLDDLPAWGMVGEVVLSEPELNELEARVQELGSSGGVLGGSGALGVGGLLGGSGGGGVDGVAVAQLTGAFEDRNDAYVYTHKKIVL